MSHLSATATDLRHERVHALDSLRFVAAFSVLLFHYTFRGAAGHAGNAFTSFNYPPLWALSRYGYLGVNLFFLISGFVFLMTANGSTPKRFFISRFVRLYPAYWVCCSLTFIAAALAADSRFTTSIPAYLENMTMLNGLTGKANFVDSAYWSLAVELKFYFLVFCLLALRQFGRLKPLLGIWFAGAVIFHFHSVKCLHFLLMPDFAAYFIAGAAFYLAYREGWSPYKVFLVLGAFFMVLLCGLEEAKRHVVDYGPPCSDWVVAGCLTAFFAVFFLITSRRLQALCSPKWLFLGTLTYPLYLLHQNIGYIIFNQFHNRINKHLLFFGVTGLMIIAAGCVHTFVERRYSSRLRNLLERFLQVTLIHSSKSAPSTNSLLREPK